MPRLVSRETRVILNVDDVTASTLGPEWVPLVDGIDPAGILPPRGNAPRGAWVAYARSLGIDVEDSMKVRDIRAAVDALTSDEDEDESGGDGPDAPAEEGAPPDVDSVAAGEDGPGTGEPAPSESAEGEQGDEPAEAPATQW